MVDSILNSIKILLAIGLDDTSFDDELIMHINASFGSLSLLGLSKVDDFEITGPENVWNQVIPDDQTINEIKMYIYHSTKIAFDPPQNSFLVKSTHDQIEKLAWLIQVKIENHNITTPIL